MKIGLMKGKGFTALSLSLGLAALIAAAGASPALAYTEFQKGSSLYKAGRYQEACDAFIDAVCLKPRSYPAHYQLANTYLKLNQLDEAATEYEMCLDLFPDARTKANCQSALTFIAGKRARSVDTETVGPSDLQTALSLQGNEMAVKQQMQIEQDKRRMVAEAEQKAKNIRENAKAEVENMKMNSYWWWMNPFMNRREPVLPVGVAESVLSAADERAQSVINNAKKKAATYSPDDAAAVTTGLMSQIQPSGASGVHLSPVGTNIYVRNYAHAKGKVATK